MVISKDMSVVIEYRVRLDDGSFVKGENGPVSMNFTAGYGQVLPALEKELLGLPEGAESEFVIPAREAFGEYDSTQVRSRSYDEFPDGRDLEVGKWVVAVNEASKVQYSYLVKEKTADSIVLDFNHPLAGENLHYSVKVISVRAANKDELAYLRPCEHGGESL